MKRLLAVAMPLVLGACAMFSGAENSGSGPDRAAVERANAVEIAAGDFIDIGALPAQELAPGECGLFLFAAKPTRRFVFFSTASGGTGLMKLNGEMVTLVRTAGEGPVIDQHFTEQVYAAPAYGLTLTISIDLTSTALAGTRVDGGSMRLERQDGWKMVVPVGGATTCSEG